MKDTQVIKNLKARARRSTNGQYPFLSDTMTHDEIQHLMDGSGKTNYTVGAAMNKRYLKYTPKNV